MLRKKGSHSQKRSNDDEKNGKHARARDPNKNSTKEPIKFCPFQESLD